jgi:hypothetical protein
VIKECLASKLANPNDFMRKSIDLTKKHKSIDHISFIYLKDEVKNSHNIKKLVKKPSKPDEKIEEKKKESVVLISIGTQTEASDFKKALMKSKIFPKADIKKIGAQSVQEKYANSTSTRSESESRASMQGRVYRAILRY